ncbi:Holliday junction branch migration protein RuvA [Patescibacteria group bacterium]|nr:Holliday junction branch migration protein RuvA [Patescibacteria group bacterium]
MISYLNGQLIVKKERFIIIDVNGVGYKVFLSKKSMYQLPAIGNDIKVFCFLNVKENIMDLYGFLNYEEYEFFKILDKIKGVGPKISLEISALGSLDNIKERLLDPQQRDFVFQDIPGLGSKRAMTIILELTGKISSFAKATADKKEVKDEVVEALIGLGFSKQKAKEALDQVSEDVTSEERIQEALKILGRK